MKAIEQFPRRAVLVAAGSLLSEWRAVSGSAVPVF